MRLVASTVELVADAWDTLHDSEPGFAEAVQLAGHALIGLAPDAEPDAAQRAMQDLSRVVVALPDRWAGVDLDDLG